MSARSRSKPWWEEASRDEAAEYVTYDYRWPNPFDAAMRKRETFERSEREMDEHWDRLLRPHYKLHLADWYVPPFFYVPVRMLFHREWCLRERFGPSYYCTCQP